MRHEPVKSQKSPDGLTVIECSCGWSTRRYSKVVASLEFRDHKMSKDLERCNDYMRRTGDAPIPRTCGLCRLGPCQYYKEELPKKGIANSEAPRGPWRTLCFKSGPQDDDFMPRTCTLQANHTGDHEWTREDKVYFIIKG